jgi:hypothetical protein
MPMPLVIENNQRPHFWNRFWKKRGKTDVNLWENLYNKKI